MNLPDIPGLFTKLELLQPYHSRDKAPVVEKGYLSAVSEDKTTNEDVLNTIQTFAKGHAEGWACFAQALKVGIGNANLPQDLGLLLSAEFVADKVSLHVRHLGSKWRLTIITNTGQERGFLVPHRFLTIPKATSIGENTTHLKYEVFWESPDETQLLRAKLSRFTGFANL